MLGLILYESIQEHLRKIVKLSFVTILRLLSTGAFCEGIDAAWEVKLMV